LRRVRQSETASQINSWLRSPEHSYHEPWKICQPRSKVAPQLLYFQNLIFKGDAFGIFSANQVAAASALAKTLR
jgi:hypothetical protein